MSENGYYKTSILDEIFKLTSSLSFKNTSLDIVSSSSVSSFGTSILITGGPQSGKSSILEAVAEELKQLSLVDDILLITPEDLAIEFPGDTTRGLLQSILKYKGRTSTSTNTSNNKNEKEECKIVRKNVILLEDLDLITPSRGCSNDVVRVLMRELRNCNSTQTIILAASIEPFRIHSGILSMFEKQITLGLLNLSDRRDSLFFFTRKFFTKFNIKMDSLTTTNISLLFDLADTACLGFSIGDVKFVVQETIRRLVSMKNEEELVSHDFRMNESAVTSLYIKELESVISDHTPYQLLADGNSQVDTTISLNKQRRLHPSIVDVIDYRDSYFKELSSNSFIDKGDNDNEDEEEDFDSSNDNPRSPLSFSIADSIRPRNERTTFDDICGQLEAKSAIIESVLWQSNSAKSTTMKNLGISPATGLMLYGPPGTGKTMLAKAVAGTLRGRFIEIKIPNILSSGVGDSERALKAAFDAAQNAAPAVIFIDEIQALFCRRDGGGGDDGDRMSSMLTSQLLLSLDSLHRISEQQPDIGRVIVIAATNVPEALDPALLRPGRFDKLIYVGLPTEIDRFHLFQQKNKVIFSQLDLKDVTNLSQKLAKLTSGCSCADIENIFRVAAMISVSEFISHNVIDSFSKPTVTEDHLLTAIDRIIN